MGESFQIEQSRRMRAVADEIGEAIASASDLHLRHRPREGEWSAIEVVGHLVDKAQFWSRRVERISREDRPLLPGYDQDVYVRRRGYQMANPAPLLDQLRSEFERFAGQVEQLPDAALDREGVHAEFGPLTARRCVEYMVDSIPDHLQQLRGALADALETSRVTLAALPGERGSKATEQDGRAVSERLRTLVDPSACTRRSGAWATPTSTPRRSLFLTGPCCAGPARLMENNSGAVRSKSTEPIPRVGRSPMFRPAS